MTQPLSHNVADDREYAWRHAFAYADCYVSTDDAVAYANHYSALIADEDDARYWPSHGSVFMDWRLTQEVPLWNLA